MDITSPAPGRRREAAGGLAGRAGTRAGRPTGPRPVCAAPPTVVESPLSGRHSWVWSPPRPRAPLPLTRAYRPALIAGGR